MQKAVRKQQANSKLLGGFSMLVTAARKYHKVCAEVFDECRGSDPGLGRWQFAHAMEHFFDSVTRGQINALYSGYIEGTDQAFMDVSGFISVVEAVANSNSRAAEFADISLEMYMMLGASGTSEAELKLQEAALTTPRF